MTVSSKVGVIRLEARQLVTKRPYPKNRGTRLAKEESFKRRNLWNKNYYKKVKEAIFAFLGDKCKRCDFSDLRALQIDHVNGGGNQERKSQKGHGMLYKNILRKLIEGSEEYQILCSNCNQIKKYENNEVRKKYE